MTTLELIPNAGPGDLDTLSVEDFRTRVILPPAEQTEPEGRRRRRIDTDLPDPVNYNEIYALGAFISQDLDRDLNGDYLPDGVYEFLSGQRILALSIPSGTEPVVGSERTDVDRNGRKEDPPFGILQKDENLRYLLVREDVPLKVLQKEKPPSFEADIKRPEQQRLGSSAEFQSRVLDPAGDLNRAWQLGKVTGAPVDAELTRDHIDEKTFTFDSGKTVTFVSNYGAKENVVKAGYTEHDYGKLYREWEIAKTEEATPVYEPYPDWDYGDVPPRRPIYRRPQAQPQQSRAAELERQLLAMREDRPLVNWDDIDGDGKREQVLGYGPLEVGGVPGHTYTVVFEDADDWYKGKN